MFASTGSRWQQLTWEQRRNKRGKHGTGKIIAFQGPTKREKQGAMSQNLRTKEEWAKKKGTNCLESGPAALLIRPPAVLGAGTKAMWRS